MRSDLKNDFVVFVLVVVVGDFHFGQILINNRPFRAWINNPIFL